MALAKSVKAPAPSLYNLHTASGECTIRVALPPPEGRIYASEPEEASMRTPREPVARLLGRHVFLGPLSVPQEGFAPYSDIHALNGLQVQLCQSTLNTARKPLQKLASLKESLEVLRTLSPDDSEIIQYRQELTYLIQQVITDDNLGIYFKKEAIEAIPQADPAEVAGLIHRVLGDDKLDLYAKEAAIKSIPQADPAEVEGLRQQVAEWIRSVLGDDKLDVYDKREVIKAIPQADPADIDSLYLRAQQCINSITEEKIDFTRSPLHHDASSNDVVNFEKTGTETFVLPEAADAAVRVIPRVAAANWLKAFSDWPTWYEAGFNYVPVEDVLSITPTEPPTEMSPQVAVTTSILHGLSLRDYSTKISSQRHIKELTAMRDQIKLILVDMGINHGHDHDGNFVVVPYVDDSGEVDWSRVPRLYVIDFDQSRSTSSPQYTL